MMAAPGAAARFGDPLSAKVSWEPLAVSYSNFPIRELTIADPEHAVFAPTRIAQIFCGVFALLGAGMILLGFFPGASGAANANPALNFLFGALFAGTGSALYFIAFAPIRIDKGSGKLLKRGETVAALAAVHAVQLMPKIVTLQNQNDRPGLNSYQQYELNLVLENADRVHLAVSLGRMAAVAQARALARFLQKPLWDTGDEVAG